MKTINCEKNPISPFERYAVELSDLITKLNFLYEKGKADQALSYYGEISKCINK